MTDEEQERLEKLVTSIQRNSITENEAKNRYITKKVFGWTIGSIAALALLSLIVVSRSSSDRIDELEKRSKTSYISLSEKSFFQRVHDGFAIKIESVDLYESGIRLKGQLLNENAITHKDLKFNIELGNKKQEISIDDIAPGSASPFEVVVLDIDAATTTGAYLNYKQSKIVF